MITIQSDKIILKNQAAKLRYSENFAYNMYSYCFFINIMQSGSEALLYI